MLRAAILGLLIVGSVPAISPAAVGRAGMNDTMAFVRAAPGAGPAAHDCEASNVLRRLAGCSSLISSAKTAAPALARAYRNRAMALFSLGEKERAIRDFDQAIRFDPKDPALYLARGTALQHLDKLDRAVDDLLKAVEIDPANAAAWGNLGVAWERLGDDDRALANYDRSLGLDSENAVILNNRGNVLARMGHRRRAIEDYGRALRVDPDYASAYYNRAGELCLEGAAGSAVSDYLHAIRLGERQRTALEGFLARQGFYEAGQQSAGTSIETALQLWSEHACSAPSAAEAQSEAEAGEGDAGTRRAEGSL